MQYLVLDLECDGEKRVRRRFVDGLEPSHKIIMIQTKKEQKAPKYAYNKEGISRDYPIDLSSYNILVGHNIRYDLLYLWKNKGIQDFIKRDNTIVWDTKLVEFLLQGQNKKIEYDLMSTSIRYGGERKDDACKPYFDQGYKFSEIPQEISIPYGLQDVVATEEVFLHQLKLAEKRKLKQLIKDYCNHQVATIEMEFNGLFIDKEKLVKNKEELEEKCDFLAHEFVHDAIQGKYWPEDLQCDIKSPSQNSILFFGGTLKEEKDLPVLDDNGLPIRYKSGQKNGQIKTKKGEVDRYIKGLGLPHTHTKETKKSGIYQTGNEVLQNYDHALITDLLHFRQQYKIYSTYYCGYLECLNPHTGCIHPNINCAGPVTGRLSMSSPNCQNLSPHTFEVFKSRYENGNIITIDFSSMEVRIAALNSQDSVLIAEILSGFDMHTDNARWLYKKEPTKQERSMAKELTFGVLYGQAAHSMSERFRLPKELCQQFIDYFYSKYIGIKEWHERLKDEVYSNVFYIGSEMCSYITDSLGKRYMLYSYTNWRGNQDFSPTEYKNYTIQGMAANLMSVAAYEVYTKCREYKDTIVINEVHDECIIDTAYTNVVELANDLSDTMSQAANRTVTRCNFKTVVPIACEVSYGPNLKIAKGK